MGFLGNLFGGGGFMGTGIGKQRAPELTPDLSHLENKIGENMAKGPDALEQPVPMQQAAQAVDPQLPMGGGDLDPRHKGMFGISGPMRNILGVLGDYSMMVGGQNPIYTPQRVAEQAQERFANSLGDDFTNNPMDAVRRLQKMGYGKEALEMYNQNVKNRNDTMQAEGGYAANMATAADKRQGIADKILDAAAGSMQMAGTDPGKWGAARELAMAQAKRAGVDLDIPEAPDPAWVSGALGGATGGAEIGKSTLRREENKLRDDASMERTVYSQDAATGRTAMTQAGANARHNTPSASARLAASRRGGGGGSEKNPHHGKTKKFTDKNGKVVIGHWDSKAGRYLSTPDFKRNNPIKAKPKPEEKRSFFFF